MNKSALIKAVLAIALLSLAVVLFARLILARESRHEDAYFYDLVEHQLFVAPKGSIPPIKGIKGADLAGVRAIVICTNGNPADKQHREIAYLEKYSPEIKQLFETVRQTRAAGRVPEESIDRRQIPPNTWVRRLRDRDWHALNTPEGEQIVNEWNTPGPDGRVPVVCSP
jgi:hypothetical protein